jgi:hypothetical protein
MRPGRGPGSLDDVELAALSTLLATLIALALVDSTSFGTLLVPLWLMTAPGEAGRPLRARRVATFLLVVAGFYLAVGAALLLGGTAVLDALGSVDLPPSATTVARWLQLALGVALFAASFRFGGRRGSAGSAGAARLLRWRDRAVRGDGSARALVLLALAAAGLEVATMLPYLGAIGLLASSELTTPARLVVLAAYCLVMIGPALALLALRVALRDRVEGGLRRLSGWLERAGGEATAWVLGIAGFLVAADAAQTLLG